MQGWGQHTGLHARFALCRINDGVNDRINDRISLLALRSIKGKALNTALEAHIFGSSHVVEFLRRPNGIESPCAASQTLSITMHKEY